MTEKIKLQGQATRKTLLLLHQLVERGLSTDTEKNVSLLEGITEEEKQEVLTLSSDLLAKGGLIDMHEKLKSF